MLQRCSYQQWGDCTEGNRNPRRLGRLWYWPERKVRTWTTVLRFGSVPPKTHMLKTWSLAYDTNQEVEELSCWRFQRDEVRLLRVHPWVWYWDPEPFLSLPASWMPMKSANFSCFDFPTMTDCDLGCQLNKPFLPSAVSCQLFYHSNRNEARTHPGSLT